jgi:putative transposase
MFVVEQFLQPLGKKYGNIKVSTDTGAWYPNAGKFSKLGHHLHSMYEKSIVERTIQYMFYCRFWNKPLYHYIITFNKYC